MSNNSIALTYLGNKVNTSVATCLKYLQDYDGNTIPFNTIFLNTCCSQWNEYEYKLSQLTAGGEICFNAGTIEILSATTVPNNLTIYGVGKDATILQLPANSAITNVFTANAISNLTISDLTIDLNNVSGANALVFTSCDNITLKNCKITNSLNASMLSITASSTNMTIDNCVFDTAAGTGNTFEINSGGAKVVNSKLIDLPSILFEDGTNGIVFSNNVVDGHGAFELLNVENVNITSNIIKNYQTPIILTTATACIINDNIFKVSGNIDVINILAGTNIQFINNLIDSTAPGLIDIAATANTVYVKNNNICGTITNPALSFYTISTSATNVCAINNHSKRAVDVAANQAFSNLYDSQLDINITDAGPLDITLSALTSATNEQYVYVSSNAASIGDFDLLGLYDPVGGYTHTVVSAGQTCVIMWTGLHWRLIDPGNTAPA